jgi:hypothetical protein
MATPTATGRQYDTGWLVRRCSLTVVGMAGVTAALTIMFFAMRAVMEIGGSCASGNTPYEISRPCPDGVPGLMIGSIFLGLLLLGVYGLNAVGPNLTLLAWPALFLSLGWNFLDFGVNPPDGSDGLVWGWLLCGVLFVLMGGAPLLIGIKAVMQGRETRATRARKSLANRYSSTERDVIDRGTTVWKVGLGLQLASIAVGIWLGIELYEWGSGTSVAVHFG